MSKRTHPRPVDPSHVEVRAYFAWLASGATHGHDVTDWLAAEAAQRRSDAARAGAATRAARAAYTADAAHYANSMANLRVYEAGLPGPYRAH